MTQRASIGADAGISQQNCGAMPLRFPQMIGPKIMANDDRRDGIDHSDKTSRILKTIKWQIAHHFRGNVGALDIGVCTRRKECQHAHGGGEALVDFLQQRPRLLIFAHRTGMNPKTWARIIDGGQLRC